MIWWRFTQGAAIFPIVGMYIIYWVEGSYGFAVPVNNSWCGNDTCSGGTSALWTATGNLGVADHNYLMFKNMHPQGTNSTSQGWLAAYSYYAADVNGNSLFWYVGFSQLVNLIITVVSFFPFKHKYEYEVAMNELAAQSADEQASEETCVDGVDQNGDVCEQSYDDEASTTESTCVDGLD